MAGEFGEWLLRGLLSLVLALVLADVDVGLLERVGLGILTDCDGGTFCKRIVIHVGVGERTVCFGLAAWVQRELSLLPGRRLLLIWRCTSALMASQATAASVGAGSAVGLA